MLGRSALRSPRARSAFTSSRKPAASMASKRCAMRWCSQPRSAGSSENSGVASHSGDCAPGCRAWKLDQGCPVSRNTSSARWMRCASPGASRAAVGGSTRASSACSAGQPSLGRLRFQLGAHRGVGRRHGVEPVEPGLEVQHGAAHQQRQLAARVDLAAPAAGRRPRTRRRCRPAADRGCRSGGAARRRVPRRVGLAVPMSMPRYTRAESTLTISTPCCCAIASAAALLPEAVGPASAIARAVSGPARLAIFLHQRPGQRRRCTRSRTRRRW